MYVDDLVSGGNILRQCERIKQKETKIFIFNVHKWYSNVPTLENLDCSNNEGLTHLRKAAFSEQ